MGKRDLIYGQKRPKYAREQLRRQQIKLTLLDNFDN
jgi:hypothetical protein